MGNKEVWNIITIFWYTEKIDNFHIFKLMTNVRIVSFKVNCEKHSNLSLKVCFNQDWWSCEEIFEKFHCNLKISLNLFRFRISRLQSPWKSMLWDSIKEICRSSEKMLLPQAWTVPTCRIYQIWWDKWQEEREENRK